MKNSTCIIFIFWWFIGSADAGVEGGAKIGLVSINNLSPYTHTSALALTGNLSAVLVPNAALELAITATAPGEVQDDFNRTMYNWEMRSASLSTVFRYQINSLLLAGKFGVVKSQVEHLTASQSLEMVENTSIFASVSIGALQKNDVVIELEMFRYLERVGDISRGILIGVQMPIIK